MLLSLKSTTSETNSAENLCKQSRVSAYEYTGIINPESLLVKSSVKEFFSPYLGPESSKLIPQAIPTRLQGMDLDCAEGL
jgi:hypothetical protein